MADSRRKNDIGKQFAYALFETNGRYSFSSNISMVSDIIQSFVRPDKIWIIYADGSAVMLSPNPGETLTNDDLVFMMLSAVSLDHRNNRK